MRTYPHAQHERGCRRVRRGHGPHGGRGRRPRGDVRAAILVLLDEEPRNGYGLMQEIEQRSSGAWRPSPGSVYPVLAQLEDEGLVENDTTGERKVVTLTDAGKAYVEEHRERLGTPWETAAAGFSEDLLELRSLVGQIRNAAGEVMFSGNAGQHREARELLAETRRALYRILAGDEPTK